MSHQNRQITSYSTGTFLASQHATMHGKQDIFLRTAHYYEDSSEESHETLTTENLRSDTWITENIVTLQVQKSTQHINYFT